MKKAALFIFIALCLLTLSGESALAYGGGTGLPPGFTPPPRIRLDCGYKVLTLHLPFNRTRVVTYPHCEVVMVHIDHGQFDDRFSNFLNRVRYGRSSSHENG